jgi:membrane protein
MTFKKRVRGIVDVWVDVFREHNLLTYASAMAFQGLVALVPLVLLGFGIMGATGHRGLWEDRMGPAVQSKLAEPTFVAVNYAVERILESPSAGLIVFGVVLTVWEVSGAVRTVMGALNSVHGVDESRAWWLRFPISMAVAVAVSACVLGAIGLLVGVRGLWAAAAWPAAVVLLGLAVATLVRWAPVREQPARWVSAGAALVVVAWIVSGLIFRVYVTDVASFQSTWGSLVVILVLTSFLYVNSIVFLVGVQLDELLEDGILEPYLPLPRSARARSGGGRARRARSAR